jgi:hypothetical protein
MNGRPPAPSVRHQPERRDLGGGVDAGRVAGEATDGGHPRWAQARRHPFSGCWPHCRAASIVWCASRGHPGRTRNLAAARPPRSVLPLAPPRRRAARESFSGQACAAPAARFGSDRHLGATPAGRPAVPAVASYLITFVGADKRLVPNVLHCCALFGTEPQGGCGHVEYPTVPLCGTGWPCWTGSSSSEARLAPIGSERGW